VGWLPCLAAVLPPKITIVLYNKAFDVSERNGRLDAGRISGPPQLGLTSEFSPLDELSVIKYIGRRLVSRNA
jgi:hypothetical protein